MESLKGRNFQGQWTTKITLSNNKEIGNIYRKQKT